MRAIGTPGKDKHRRKHGVAIGCVVDRHMWLAAAVFVQQLVQLKTTLPMSTRDQRLTCGRPVRSVPVPQRRLAFHTRAKSLLCSLGAVLRPIPSRLHAWLER